MKFGLNAIYRCLCIVSKEGELLFGNNVQERMKELNEVNTVREKLQDFKGMSTNQNRFKNRSARYKPNIGGHGGHQRGQWQNQGHQGSCGSGQAYQHRPTFDKKAY